MKCTQLIKSILAIFLIGYFSALTASGQSSRTYQNTLKLLSTMNGQIVNSDNLTTLFRVGDKRIADLLRALDDPNPTVSLRAQTVIRYLGNEVGLRGLFEWYSKQKQFQVAGPIPLPLGDWDFKVVYAQYINEPPEKWVKSEPYIYALALDDSANAKEALERMIKIAGNLDEATVAYQAARRVEASQVTKILTGKENLPDLVRDNAFFVAPNDRKYLSARLLALNGAKDKALIEVHLDRGSLSEEWYHVVIQKYKNGWKFFSVTPVAAS